MVKYLQTDWLIWSSLENFTVYGSEVLQMDWGKISEFLTTAGVDLLRGIGVLAVGLFLVHWVMKFLERYEKRINMEPTIKGFIKKLVRVLLYILVILTTVSIMGVPMTSIVTLLASAGVAVSLAMQGVLSNLIGGFILILFKPIRTGEFIRVGENEGTVKAIGTFYTELATIDNKHINLPNSSLTNAAIINYSREGTRRLDLTFSVSYESDMDRVYEVLNRVIEEEDRLLQDPAPAVNLNKCGDSSLDFLLRAWVTTENYWPVFFSLTENGKRALDRAGISIPYPQMDVHMK